MAGSDPHGVPILVPPPWWFGERLPVSQADFDQQDAMVSRNGKDSRE
jgi:hypothetical protein